MIPLKNTLRFMLVGLVPPREDKERMLSVFEEAESLVRTYGGEVFAATSQNSTRRDQSTFIGTGKAQEIAETIIVERIDVVVINDLVKPGQLFTLKKIFERGNPHVEVWDRTDLILHIFSKHAATSLAKLQIKLAFMRHMGPRIYGMGMEMSQQAGGIGTVGIGETNTERMRRHWKNEMRHVNSELEKLSKARTQQMSKRKRSGMVTISIIGYTNAGKTTLYNALSGEDKLVENALFATLDSNVSKIYLQNIRKEAYVTDTIGFIQNLPHQLVDAFKSTLIETINADILLHVIDASDMWMEERIETVEQILKELRSDTENQLFVFNKIDLAKNMNKEYLLKKYNPYHPVFISAYEKLGLDTLRIAIGKMLVKTL